MQDAKDRPKSGRVAGPAKLRSFAHVSVPCRDLDEGKEFYGAVLGGELHVDQPTFASFRLGGIDVGIGTEGCSWLGQGAEYPHFAFFVGPDELAQMKDWLGQHGIPTSNYWTRRGIEALMFFRDPSGNVIELYCDSGFPDADRLPKGPPRGHGTAVDIDALRYDRWKRPSQGR